jgi:N6-L-threonylcarbamoyladenine synthase
VAVTEGPGLAGSLLVGINFAKTLAYVHGKPLVPVNHLEGHLYAAWLDDETRDVAEPIFPLVALIVSGGHTFLVEMRDHLQYRLLGETVDDAAGEAFDKVGRLLGLPYPGGPEIMKAAAGATGTTSSSRGPGSATRSTSASAASRPRPGERSRPRPTARDFVGDSPLPADRVAELAYGFQESVVDVLVTKTLRAARRAGARSVVLGGGVAANRVLRDRLAAGAASRGIPLVVPRPALCTDNGAMIGAAGARRFAAGRAGRARPGRAAVAAAGSPVSESPDRRPGPQVRRGGRGPRPGRRPAPRLWTRFPFGGSCAARASGPPLDVAELPGRSRRAAVHPGSGRARAGPPHPGGRTRAGHPDRRAARRRRGGHRGRTRPSASPAG